MLFHVEIDVTLPRSSPTTGALRSWPRSWSAVSSCIGQASSSTSGVPGALRNIGVWDAADATDLHMYISSLPLFRYARADVIPLADHPVAVAAR